MKNGGFMKDALILFVITLISGFLLGGAYQITKDPIEKATEAANMAAYKKVFPEAAEFTSDDKMEAAVESCNTELLSQNFGKVGVENAFQAVDASGTALGYVITSYSGDSYSGVVKISVGIKEDGTINGIEFLEISDTPGLGLKAKEPAFKDQYAGKNKESLTVTKSGNAGDGEINAISGATITSSAVTNAVNAALYYVHSIDR
ncbi:MULTISPECIES: RnfABCDGE type electron transport complex subunit G [Clostridia]|uniref:Ion-translocating oxidoreductase complex subunit G n=1 Tax=Lacrimispora celerecrescens TaxID=29354 RepID=A0A084JK94_9FIRM|nr:MULTISPECIES: RnfABCDGE type electron transport complex subunit G [Clostridia]KEZ89378.1 electron transporter RnfG [Lacrimispora celerecrescens]MBW4845436.1 RnfABCDGE type electron transport complex subunit G [Lachnospiraceae bacterium]MSS09810.1 RnfABCDGE type electron transport complex subunit G [Clostridium sp. WB02_MRS01]HBG13413.1 RnfABCDGE type electron transport complex subunit G [Clostridium sp.]